MSLGAAQSPNECHRLRNSEIIARMPRALAFVALAVPSIFVAVCAYSPEYAFHA